MRIEVDQLPPRECSPNWRGHWSLKYPAAKAFQEAVYYEAVNVRNTLKVPWSTPAHPFSKARLDLIFIFNHWQGRDEDNLRAAFKPGQDALVQAHLIADDTPVYLELGTIEFVIDRRQSPKTIITLTEVGDGEGSTPRD